MSPATDREIDLRQVERFIVREARLADTHDYDGWEALWTDDAVYWVPLGDPGEAEPGTTMSIIFDNRRRLTTRLNQLRTGRRLAQSPPSRLRRVVSNVEIVSVDGDLLFAEANFVLVECRPRGQELWAGRVVYGLRAAGEDLRLSYKRVELLNSDQPLPTLAFLL